MQAYELRRRGVDVEATALPDRFHPHRGRPLADVEDAWGRTFTLAAKTDIEKAFESFGPGSRGVVHATWQGNGAHVFNVENVGGTVRFVDGQNAGVDVSGYFDIAKSTSFVRLDDLPTPSHLTEFVRPRR